MRKLKNDALNIFYVIFFPLCICAHADQTVIVFNSAQEAALFGIQNSKSLNLQKLQQLANLASATYSFRDFLPSVSLSYSENDSITKNAPDSRTKTFQVSLTQPVFDGGKKELEYELSRINARYAWYEYELSVRNYESQLIQLYYQYNMQKKSLDIQTELLSVARKRLAIIKKEFELGLTLEIDYLDYELSVLQLEYERSKYERELHKYERRLKIMLDIDDDVPIEIRDNFYGKTDYPLLEAKIEKIWTRVQNISIELQKQRTNQEFKGRLMRFDQLRNIPVFSLMTSINFSGTRFPLTEPSFSVRCLINLQNRLFPTDISNTYNLTQNGLQGISNSIDTRLLPSSTLFIEQRIAKLSLLTAEEDYKKTKKDLQSTVFDAVYNHDDTVKDLQTKEQMLRLMNKKIQINGFRLEKGEIKQIDYLNALIESAKAEIEYASLQTQIETLERSLEINTGIGFGELHHADFL